MATSTYWWPAFMGNEGADAPNRPIPIYVPIISQTWQSFVMFDILTIFSRESIDSMI